MLHAMSLEKEQVQLQLQKKKKKKKKKKKTMYTTIPAAMLAPPTEPVHKVIHGIHHSKVRLKKRTGTCDFVSTIRVEKQS
jgi:hypothetical protein